MTRWWVKERSEVHPHAPFHPSLFNTHPSLFTVPSCLSGKWSMSKKNRPNLSSSARFTAVREELRKGRSIIKKPAIKPNLKHEFEFIIYRSQAMKITDKVRERVVALRALEKFEIREL
jgi:hypothetical protein